MFERKQDFTLGCRKLFEKTHPGSVIGKGIGKHPNSYFSSSYWAKNKQTDRKPAIDSTLNNIT